MFPQRYKCGSQGKYNDVVSVVFITASSPTLSFIVWSATVIFIKSTAGNFYFIQMIYFYTCEEKTFLLTVCDLLKESCHNVLCFKTLWLDNLVSNRTACKGKILSINFNLTKDNLSLTITSILINIPIKNGIKLCKGVSDFHKAIMGVCY